MIGPRLSSECKDGEEHIMWETSNSWDQPHLITYTCQKCGEVLIQPEDLGSGG